MTDFFLAPRRYVQRAGVIAETGEHLKLFGRRPLVLGDELVFSILRPALDQDLLAAGLAPHFMLFGGECCRNEIDRLMEASLQEGVDLVAGTGGGKALDAARVVADRLRLPLINIPTSAATCSAASSAAVIYERGIRQGSINGKGAELVLVDSTLLSRAPARLLAAGMGDALAKWYEGKPTYDQKTQRSPALEAAMTLSIQVRETIFRWGLQAKRDVEGQENSFAVETVVESNILLAGMISGLGGSLFRTALAHALFYGLMVLPQAHQNLHGEIVSFGLVVQLCLEKKEEELKRLLPFLAQLGLPLTLKELGLSQVEDPLFLEGIRRTCLPGTSAHNLPFTVDERKVFEAVMEADQKARSLK